jgi:hypothetical protein
VTASDSHEIISADVHEPGAEGGSNPLPFDPEKYLPRLWSEKVQDERLEALWNIVNTFVDLAWGADSAEWTSDMPPKAYYEFMP